MSKIYINPGHGGADSGAVGIGGRQEKADNLIYASAVAEKLHAAGHDVKLERDGDYLINVKDIAERANAWGADYFIAFHRNSGGGTGAECLIVSSASAKSREMAQAIQNTLAAVGFKNRGVKVQDKNTYVLSHTTMPATTIECGFIDNAGDNALFDSKQGEIVQGITDAVLSIAGGAEQSPATPQEPEKDAAWNVDHTLYRPCHVELKNYMNFRTGPGEEHSVIRRLHNSDKLVLLENCENNWLKVLFLETGEQGYVFSEWIVFDGMMRGEDVRGLQRAINKHTGLGISEDAALGDKTAHGIVQLQKALGLKQDGQAGKDTVTAAGGKWTKK